jgi:hypothetical protein
MINLKRYGPALATAAAFAAVAVAVAPAANADTAGARSAVVQETAAGTVFPASCAVLTAKLNVQLQAAATALATLSTPPTASIVTAKAAVTAAQALIAQLQADLCLPAAGVTVVAQLNPNLVAVNGILAAALNPNLAVNGSLATTNPKLVVVNGTLATTNPNLVAANAAINLALHSTAGLSVGI